MLALCSLLWGLFLDGASSDIQVHKGALAMKLYSCSTVRRHQQELAVSIYLMEVLPSKGSCIYGISRGTSVFEETYRGKIRGGVSCTHCLTTIDNSSKESIQRTSLTRWQLMSRSFSIIRRLFVAQSGAQDGIRTGRTSPRTRTTHL